MVLSIVRTNLQMIMKNNININEDIGSEHIQVMEKVILVSTMLGTFNTSLRTTIIHEELNTIKENLPNQI